MHGTSLFVIHKLVSFLFAHMQARLSGSQCTDVVVQDIALTYSKLLLLTSNGLLVSNDTEVIFEFGMKLYDCGGPLQHTGWISSTSVC